MSLLYKIKVDGTVLQAWEIGDQPVVVGRDSQADVKITDERLSRAHFAIVREGSAFYIRDFNSANGTWVRGRRITTQRLQPNDCIRAGRTRFVFEEGLATAVATFAAGHDGDTRVMA